MSTSYSNSSNSSSSSSSSSSSPSISHDCCLIELRGPENIRAWSHFLRVELDAAFQDLSTAVFGTPMDFPRSSVENASLEAREAWRIWKVQRAKALRILCSTLRNPKVMERLVEQEGWDPKKDADPASLYQLIWKIFGPPAEKPATGTGTASS